MAGEKTAPLTPKLRFPEFQNRPFREVKLRDVTSESRVRNREKAPKFKVMGVSKSEGVIPMEERLIASDASRYKVVRKDWFAYNPMRLNIGSIARWSGDEDVLVSPDYVVFRCDEEGGQDSLLPDFFDQFRSADAWDAFVNEAGDGGVRVRIYYDNIGQIDLALPSLPEQQKIADCLGSLNDVIEAESRKLEALRRHKKGLMQQLFPQPGETVPRLRFSEFQDAGDWRERKVSEVSTLKAGDAIATAEIAAGKKEGLFPCFGGNGVRGYVNSFNYDGRYVLVGRQGALCGNVTLVDGQFHATEHALVAVAKPETDIDFIYFAFEALNLNRFATGQAQPGLSVGVLNEVRLYSPSEVSEQRRVARCLATSDEQVSFQIQKLDILKLHKRGMLQQLFPSLEGSEQ